MKGLCNIHGVFDKSHKTDRCTKCKKRTTREYDSKYRNKEADKFYRSRAWKRVRVLQLSRFPLCVKCERPAEIVDHITEIRDGGKKLSLSNLQSMCKSCHNEKTAAVKAGRGAVKSLQASQPYTDAPSKLSQNTFRGGTPS